MRCKGVVIGVAIGLFYVVVYFMSDLLNIAVSEGVVSQVFIAGNSVATSLWILIIDNINVNSDLMESAIFVVLTSTYFSALGAFVCHCYTNKKRRFFFLVVVAIFVLHLLCYSYVHAVFKGVEGTIENVVSQWYK